jgi:hypothetical protein
MLASCADMLSHSVSVVVVLKHLLFCCLSGFYGGQKYVFFSFKNFMNFYGRKDRK